MDHIDLHATRIVHASSHGMGQPKAKTAHDLTHRMGHDR
jgi:hypothetical protein